MGMIDTAIEARSQDNPELLKKLYEANPRTFTPGVETIGTEPPRPIINLPGAAMMMPPVSVIGVTPIPSPLETSRQSGAPPRMTPQTPAAAPNTAPSTGR